MGGGRGEGCGSGELWRIVEGGLGKREMGLLCGASSIRRRQKKVHELAISLGWSWQQGENAAAGIGGLGWMWGCDDEGPFERGVHYRKWGV